MSQPVDDVFSIVDTQTRMVCESIDELLRLFRVIVAVEVSRACFMPVCIAHDDKVSMLRDVATKSSCICAV